MKIDHYYQLEQFYIPRFTTFLLNFKMLQTHFSFCVLILNVINTFLIFILNFKMLSTLLAVLQS